ncbi:T6SS immunity protein Tli4 family protein [Pseudoduganella violaceinigra]|uniref:T6SS immunity protein Tli4 family protein n=1 Tax=Pseudoduganella violaceinigra TaxID=246602 RepID=UPI0035308B69
MNCLRNPAYALTAPLGREPNNPMLPAFDIALDTGVKGNRTSGSIPSITDEEAVYLWDRLTASIRPRPVTNNRTK